MIELLKPLALLSEQVGSQWHSWKIQKHKVRKPYIIYKPRNTKTKRLLLTATVSVWSFLLPTEQSIIKPKCKYVGVAFAILYLSLSLFLSVCGRLFAVKINSFSLLVHTALTQVAQSLQSPFEMIVRWSKAQAGKEKKKKSVAAVFV